MGKTVKKVLGTVLKIAAIVVPFIPGIGMIAGALIAVGLAVGSSLLSSKPKMPVPSQANIDRLRANIDPRTPRKTVVGITAMACDIRDEEFTSDQEYFHRFIVVASHKAEAIDEVWFDDKMAWSDGGGVTSDFSGYLTVAAVLEGSAGNAINISARMGSTRRYTGLAYIHLRYKLTGNSSKAESPFAQGITTRITIRGKGAAIYDPREDSTVDGGSGSQVAEDQDTWVWDDDACRNPALALLFYLLGYRINDLLAVGKGIPPERIDLESFAVAANICDELVSKVGGGTEPRYRCDGVWSEGDAPSTVMDMLKSCMNADLDDVDGKLRLTIFHDDLATPVTDFTDDDVLGGFVWEQTPSLDQTFNIVRGVYTDASDEALYQPLDYPEVAIASPDGIDRIATLDLPMVQSAGQAQRLAQMRLKRQENGGTFKAEFQATAWKVQKNSVVTLTFAATGFEEKLFRVAEMDIQVDGRVPLVLREESADNYTGPSLSAPLAPVASTPSNPLLNPILQHLNGIAQIELVRSRNYPADYTGAVLPALLPDIIVPIVTLGGVDVRTEDYTTYSLTASGGISASVNNTPADPDKGTIEITAVDVLDGWVDLTVTVNGIVQPTQRIVIQRLDGLPSGFGGSGAKIASDNSFATLASLSYLPITDIMTVTVASGESLYGTAPLTYYSPDAGPIAATAKWQHSPVGAGTWTDFDTAITGSDAYTGVWPGTGYFSHNATGLTPGDFDVQLVALCTAAGTLNFSGTATIEAKV